MTLVAGLSVGGLPAFIGDLLVSWRTPSAVDLPTQREERVLRGLGTDHAAGLAQKLVIIRPYLMIAWAGDRADAERMICELNDHLPPEVGQLNDTKDIFSILNTCGENTELVALLIWGENIHPLGVRTRGFELDNRRIYLLGSGAQDFFEHLQTHPDLLSGQEQQSGLVARAIMLRFAARAMVGQWIAGVGLENSWGGGFENAYPDEDRGGFGKIGNVLFRAWMIEEDGSYHNSGRSFFSRYYGQDLYLSCFNPDEKTYIVRSPIAEPVKPPKYERVHPEWTLDVFVMRTGAFIEFARYQPPYWPVADFVELQNGMLTGWAMDRRHVELCVKKAIASSGGGSRFVMSRY
jgi:hypothetical protein